MARKKDKVMAFDTLQPDSLRIPSGRVCRNFICYESKVKDCLVEEDIEESWKHDAGRTKEFDTLVGYQTEARGGIGNLGNDIISLIPVTLEKSVKPSVEYIYRIFDYGTSKNDGIYCTKKEAVQYVQRKIKSKNVRLVYGGKVEKAELDIGGIDSILSELEPETLDFGIIPLGRGDVEGDMILLTIYKNLLKF